MINQKKIASDLESALRPLLIEPWEVRVVVSAENSHLLAVGLTQPTVQLTVAIYWDIHRGGKDAVQEIARRINEQYALYLQRLTPPFETPKGPTI